MIPSRRWLLFRHHHLQTNTGSHSPSYPLCAKGSFCLGKTVGEWSCPSTSIYCQCLQQNTWGFSSNSSCVPSWLWDHFASIIVRDYDPSDSRTSAPSVRAASVVKTEEILTEHRVLEAIKLFHCDPSTFRFSIHLKATLQNLPSPAET
jgi:hypothetical protein